MATYKVKAARSSYLHLRPHEDAASAESFGEWCRTHERQGEGLAVDLFSGAGGLSLGIEKAGWTVAASVDHYQAALETHRHNFGGLALDWDLGEESGRDRFVDLFEGVDVDLVAGGPPCQPFSRAGRAKIRSLVDAGERSRIDPRRHLWAAFLDIALRLHPRAVLMENVPDMGLADDFAVLRGMTETLQKAGYRTSINLVSAWHFGVPQHRQRMILLARRDGRAFGWPEIQEKLALEDVLGDLPDLHGGVGGRRMSYTKAPVTDFEKLMREGSSKVVYDHMTRAVRDDDREIFEFMDKPNVLYSDVPKHLRRYRADNFTDKYHRLDKAGLSRSITAHIAKDGYWYIHPWEQRTLTVREAARIQTFPDRFRFAGSRSDAFKQIGNAVPPLLGMAAASALAHQLPKVTGEPGTCAAQHALDSWAKWQQAMRTLEPCFPGPSMTPLAALAMAVQHRSSTSDEQLSNAVRPLLGRSSLTPRLLGQCVNAAANERQRNALTRLGRLVPSGGGLGAEEFAETELTSSEWQVFALLSGDDTLIRGAAPVRVAARVLGVDSDGRKLNTAGRLTLAELVGSGESAPARMAAIRLVGRRYCSASSPNCGACPLQDCCAWAQASGETTVNQPSLIEAG